jgi:hypothetical protein
MIGRGNRSTRRKPAPVPLCPPQAPHACPDANPGHRGGKPATNLLSYGMALSRRYGPLYGHVCWTYLLHVSITSSEYSRQNPNRRVKPYTSQATIAVGRFTTPTLAHGRPQLWIWSSCRLSSLRIFVVFFSAPRKCRNYTSNQATATATAAALFHVHLDCIHWT